MTGDLPVVGDWKGAGVSQLGLFRPSTGEWFLDYNGNKSWNGCSKERCKSFGRAGDQPVTGDWNGSGTSKIGVFRPSTGAVVPGLQRQWNMGRLRYRSMCGELRRPGRYPRRRQMVVSAEAT